MARAAEAYLRDNSPAMSRRTLFVLLAAILYREPMPITCLSCPVRGKAFPSVADITSRAQTKEC
jgi:hypothetical protein